MTMRSILSLGLAALAASAPAVSAETTIAILEFGPGGAVHRTTSTVTESNPAAVTSFWNALHRPSKRSSMSRHAGMPVVPDVFNSADAGIVIGLKGESVKSMPTAASLLDVEASADNVVGHFHLPGQVGTALMKNASEENVETVAKEDMGRRLQSTAETAARGAQEGIEALSLAIDSDKAAAVADEQLGRMLKTLKKEAKSSGKTVIVHLVVEDETRRRLDEDNENGENNNNYSYSNEKSMYQIQSFNLYLWTAVGLFVIVFSVIRTFIAMPLFPDTLLFAEAAKIGSE